MKTIDPQSPGPSACLVETKENLENTEVNPNAPESADGDIHIEYFSD
jgi:hypothetical protein